jgi:hypothetical protein
MNRPKFIVKGHNLLNTQSAVNIIGKELRYNELDLLYDPTLSVAENMANGMGVSQATLYRYCQNRQLDTTPREMPTQAEKKEDARNEKERKIELFRSLYNPNLSVRGNVEMMEQHGLKISKSTLSEWVKKYIIISDKSITSPFTLSIFGQMEEKPPGYDWNVPLPSFIQGWNFT